MQNLLEKLKMEITSLASDDKFIHHKWFVTWHLEIVERISLELCDIYTNADTNIVLGLVWMHDYSKITGNHDSEREISFLKDIGFTKEFIDQLMKYIEIMESYMSEDLSQAPIEVQIVSSADAASHFVGPFFPLFWYENPDKSIDDLLIGNNKKLEKDWNRKIVLPEVKKSFQERYNHLKETFGSLPDHFIIDQEE